MSRTLLVTNDFPPRRGGIQTFVHGMALRLPSDDLVVYTSSSPGHAEFDASQPFTVVRDRTSMLLPTPRVARAVTQLAREHRCDRVWFGAAAPLGLLAPRLLRDTGIERAIALTHGHEVGWAAMPGTRQALRRIAASLDVMTYLGGYTYRRIAPVAGNLTRLEQLTFGIDTETFNPEVDGTPIRDRHGLGDRPVIVCVSRLVPRKGQDKLIAALPHVRGQVGEDVRLLIVGHGPYEGRLRSLARHYGVEDSVTFTGGVPEGELARHFAAGDVFAMPCRTRKRGLDVEGLGAVFLEAAACGLPVIAGDSGGAPDTVLHDQSGWVVDGRNVGEIAYRLTKVLTDRPLADKFASASREWACSEWTWDRQAGRLEAMLYGETV
ncbi:glycosyltransferase family 4 protein [Glycomyces sp. L485]|uniref:glycosyltransferase family 4 protein n=1 Tax=Glycomyces sp. L485 TaxID=2909235 RepID=UPI001F4ABA6C|nr:glycosyltransferase family 4 protein [Glycomyces sp. L485]MCH7232415.1 glycosyltransferase family 4 protein [Glycomyces sp. L485]